MPYNLQELVYYDITKILMLERQTTSRPGNRAMRRHNSDADALKGAAMVKEFNRRGVLLNATNNVFNQVVKKYEQNPARIVYQGQPFINNWLEVRHKLPGFLKRAHISNLEDPFVTQETLSQFDTQDSFSTKLGGRTFLGLPILEGTSLTDVEQMPLLRLDGRVSLSTDDIRRINRMFHYRIFPWSSKETTTESLIRQSMLYLAVQKAARPEEKITISQTLHPLYERLIAYFDYYKDLMTDFNLEGLDEKQLLVTLGWGRPWIPQAVGCYIPARLGITPASAIKLYQTHAEFSSMPTYFWRRNILPSMEFGAKHAIRRNALPADLERYQKYSEQMDKEAAEQLADYYQKQDLSEQKENPVAKLTGLYFKSLQDDVVRLPNRVIEIAMPEGLPVAKVMIASHNRNTLMFVLSFTDGQTHLTLEIDRDQNIYGFPAKLIYDNPHFAELILRDILPPVLEWAKFKYPGIEPIRLSDYRREERKVPAVGQPQATEALPSRVERPLKRYRVLTPLARILDAPEPPHFHTEPLRRTRSVIYSRSSVIEKMGGTPRPKDVDRVIETIRRFELGLVQVRKISWSGGERESVRIGDLRAVLNKVSDTVYVLEYIRDRENVYRRYGDHKV